MSLSNKGAGHLWRCFEAFDEAMASAIDEAEEQGGKVIVNNKLNPEFVDMTLFGRSGHSKAVQAVLFENDQIVRKNVEDTPILWQHLWS